MSQEKSVLPPLPSWTDAPAIASYVVSLASLIIPMLVVFHIGVPTSVTSNVQTWAAGIGLVVAGVVQLVNLITHRKAITSITLAQMRYDHIVHLKMIDLAHSPTIQVSGNVGVGGSAIPS